MEQTPTRFVMKNKVLLSRLKHVQLYFLVTYMKERNTIDLRSYFIFITDMEFYD